MLNINKVVLVGRLTKDPELRKTQSNASVCQFTLAVNRNYKPENGQQEADFIQCVAWRQSADYLTQYARKGDQVGVDGEVQTRSYESDGKKVYVTEIKVNHLCIESKRAAETKPAPSYEPSYEPTSEPTYPEEDNFSNTPSLDISSDDLPFY